MKLFFVLFCAVLVPVGVVLLWSVNTDSYSIVNCGPSLDCELATDSEAMMVLTAYLSTDRELRESSPGFKLRRQYPDLVIAKRILRIDRGTRVYVTGETPPSRNGLPRYAHVVVLSGPHNGRELFAFADYVKRASDR